MPGSRPRSRILRLRRAAQTVQGKDELKQQSYEKLQKEFQALRAQGVKALTSLKVLEDENEELMQELDQLRNRLKNAAVPKAGYAP
jgi:predicted  nucleic acid-binding Zn-ribbon protein